MSRRHQAEIGDLMTADMDVSQIPKPHRWHCILLPWPPSVNSLYRAIHGQNKLSKKGRLYYENMVENCTDYYLGPTIEEDVEVNIILFPPDKRIRDLDNHLKTVIDSLVKVCAIYDDSQVKKLCVQWGSKVIRGMAVIWLREYQGEPIDYDQIPKWKDQEDAVICSCGRVVGHDRPRHSC